VVQVQLLQIITAQYYSHLYYCAGVWLGEQTSQQITKLIDSAHYKPLRIVYHDYEKWISRVDLSRISKRAMPVQWCKYIVIGPYHSKEPYNTSKKLNETFYTTRCKPGLGHFYHNSKGKRLGSNQFRTVLE